MKTDQLFDSMSHAHEHKHRICPSNQFRDGQELAGDFNTTNLCHETGTSHSSLVLQLVRCRLAGRVAERGSQRIRWRETGSCCLRSAAQTRRARRWSPIPDQQDRPPLPLASARLLRPDMTNQRRAVTAVITLVLLLTVRDVFFRARGRESEDTEYGSEEDGQVMTGNKKIPHTNLSHILTGPTVKFLYCHSCGYRKAFDEYASILRDKYPDVTVVGDNFPASTMTAILIQTIGMLKMAIILMILANVNPFLLMGRESPAFWNWLANSKLYGCLMTFFIANTIEGQLMSSGAFEIYYNDLPIWSKIETGRIPAPAELFQIIDNQNFNNKPGVFQY